MNQKMVISVGIDLARTAKHKAVIGAAAYSEVRTPKKAYSFPHSLEGFTSVKDYVLKVTKKDSLDGVGVLMEPTGEVWRDVAQFFHLQGASVFYVRNDAVSALRKAQHRFAKTDRIDAKVLAGIPWSLPYRMIPYAPMQERIRVLRDLSNHRATLVKEISRWKNRFKALMESSWKILLVSLPNELVFSQSMRAFWKRYPHPAYVVRSGRKRFHNWCEKNLHKRVIENLEEKIFNAALEGMALWETLGRTRQKRETQAYRMKDVMMVIVTLEKQLEIVEKRINKAQKDVRECLVMRGIPGVGEVTSVTIASFIMPGRRFPSVREFASYTGFVSRVNSSGEHEIKGKRITKCGNRRIKRDLALAADTAMRLDPQLAEFAVNLLIRGKHYNKVRVAVGRKIAIRAYSLLKRIESGEENVYYQYRDLDGRIITKKEAQKIAGDIWQSYKS